MVLNIPNVLTVSRILAIPVVLAFIAWGGPLGNWLAFSAYTYACITDFFDGYLARAWHQQSAFGRFLDPIADKLLVAGVLFMLVGVESVSGVHILPAAIILCREILVSGLREFLAEARVGLPVSLLAKWKTTIQMLALGFLIVGNVGPDFGFATTWEIGVYGLWIAALITIITGYDYLCAGLRHIAEADAAAEKILRVNNMTGLQDDCFKIGDDLLAFEEGLRILKERTHVVVGTELVTLGNALGRVLAQDISAPRDVPPHDNSAVDGYGVRFSDLSSTGHTRLPVTARIAAGHPLDRASEAGEAVQIFTGAPVPAGMDTVFMQEDVALDGDHVILPDGIKCGANRRKQGEDVRSGDVVLKTGQRLRAQEIGLAASLGLGKLKVYSRLRCAVFSTGDEVFDPTFDEAKEGAIYDANRYTIGAMLKGLGCEVTDLGILPDRVADIRSALHDAYPGHDLIITSGGVSLGEEDHITHVVQSLGSIDFWRLAIKPGRPMAFGKIVDTAFVGLPGNPVAAMVTFMRIARPLIMRLSGRLEVDPHIYRVPAAFSMSKKAGRREWLRANLQRDENGQVFVHKHPSQGSGVLTSMVASDGLVELVEDLTQVNEGDLVDFLPFVEIAS